MIQMERKFWLVLFLACTFCSAFLISSCSKDDVISGPDGSPSAVVFPAERIVYRTHIQRLFLEACARAGCHYGTNPAGGLNLESYYDVTVQGGDHGPAVIPPNPESGTLVQRIEGRGGERMPYGLNPLNKNQIDGIKKWIQEGAKDTTYSANP
jgi:hypothetical protein